MSLQRRDIVEAIVFLPAMALLALVIGGGFYLVIFYGGWLLTSIFGLLRSALPHAPALAVAVILSALVVYVTVPRAISAILSLRIKQR